MIRRSHFVMLATASVLVSFAHSTAVAQLAGPPTGGRPNVMTPAAERSIDLGLSYLVASQMPNGSFGSNQYENNIAVTSLAGLAMLSQGSTPGRGPHGEALDRAVDYVLANVSPSGFVYLQTNNAHHGPMYDHGFGTLFLAEVYGMTNRPDIREKVKKAVRLICETQNREGGWRYQPERVRKADTSVTICQIMALRAARNAGLFVPRNVVDNCVDYVKRCQNRDGGFRYMVDPGPSAFPRSAAGVVALYSAGVYEGDEVERGLQYLLSQRDAAGPRMNMRQQYHYFYGHYYAVQAMYQSGDELWDRWFPSIRDELVRQQRRDGSWYDSACPEYGTAMALIILQIPNNYLPIFQR